MNPSLREIVCGLLANTDRVTPRSGTLRLSTALQQAYPDVRVAGRQSRDSRRAAVPPIIQSSSSSDAVGR
jgi:hypothetical protein